MQRDAKGLPQWCMRGGQKGVGVGEGIRRGEQAVAGGGDGGGASLERRSCCILGGGGGCNRRRSCVGGEAAFLLVFAKDKKNHKQGETVQV